PDSKVTLLAQSGDVTITIAPPTITPGRIGFGTDISPAAAAMYPASFEAIALQGDLITTGISDIRNTASAANISGVLIPMPGIVLSPSDPGTFELLAQGNIDLTFGYPKNTSTLQTDSRPLISAGPSLMDAAFDPFRPNSGNDESVSRAILAHADDLADGLD